MKRILPSIVAGPLALAAGLAAAQGYGPATPAFTPPLPEIRFASIPPAAAEKFRGNRFSYMETGPNDKPVLLLLHGVGANSAHWRFQYAGLSDRYRVIGWNAPGFVLSDAFVAETPRCQDYADAVAAFLDALSVQQAFVVGNSFGSGVAQCFAIHHAQRVRKLVLTGVLLGYAALPAETKAKMIQGREDSIRAGGMMLLNRGGALVGSRTPKELMPMLQSVLVATNPGGYMQAIRFLVSLESTTASAARFTMPLLMVQGSEDKITPTERGAIPLQQAVPGSRLEVFEGYGHLPEFENAERFNKLLRDFLG
jgi:pimeloyl-ACP methyl ester carboxylesterase